MNSVKNPLFNSELPLGAILAMLTRQYAGVFSIGIESTGADRYVTLLLLLDQATEPVSQQCLANKLKIDKSSMVRMTSHLCRQGFMKRTINPQSKREYLLALTSAGKKLIPALKVCIDKLNRDMFKGIDLNERKQFYKTLQVISCNLSAIPGDEVSLNYKLVKKK